MSTSSSSSSSSSNSHGTAPGALGKPGTVLANGVVLGKDGRPCRSCTSMKDWANFSSKIDPGKSSAGDKRSVGAVTAIAGAVTGAAGTSVGKLPRQCPPDVETLGRSTWTLLHSLAATYPENATPEQAEDMQNFLSILSRIYPCYPCAKDFELWMGKEENMLSYNAPTSRWGRGGSGLGVLGGRASLGGWLCRAHNEVNRKLGKTEFDCRTWEERWRDGWKDGTCD